MGKKKQQQRKEHRKEIVFDENARREFITGFRKRKKERRQFARHKIAEEVRQEKLKERQEHRDFMKQQKSVGTGVEVAADDDSAADSADDEAEPANAELTSFLLGDTLTTTVVEPLLSNEADEVAIEPQPSKRAPPAGRDASARNESTKRRKKFDLSVPLTVAIPGYKAPEGIKKKQKLKKGSAKRAASKKDKARARAPRRE